MFQDLPWPVESTSPQDSHVATNILQATTDLWYHYILGVQIKTLGYIHDRELKGPRLVSSQRTAYHLILRQDKT